MTTLGTALIVAGLTLVCGSMIFLLFTRREPSQESFEEDLDRIDHRLDEARRERGELSSKPPEGTEN
jgi:uncharacterized membrane-anchored protein YhcB (DUF1043 family)